MVYHKAGFIGKLFSRFSRMLNGSFRINIQQAIPFWMASLIAGLVAVGYTKLFSFTENILQRILHWHNWLIFLMTPICFFIAWLIVQVFAPNARGSGIPQVMAAIDLATPRTEKKVPKLLSLRIIFTKIASSLMMVAGGGAIGREGPTIQIASSVFMVIHKWIPETWSKLSGRAFALTGAAAGLAAAFNTPLGGVVFAMEELARIHLRYFRTVLFSAVIIAGLTAQALLGPYLYLGYPDVRGLDFSIFLGVAATAVIAGILGSFMCKAILGLMRWKRAFTKWQSVFSLLITGIVIAFTAYFIDANIIGSGKDIMNETLFSSQKSLPWYTVISRMAGPVLAFNTGAAGGVFAPSLAAGASIGAFVSDLFHIAGANANILILSGMVGFLTGVTRTPFTSAILVLEMTDRHSVIFHLMLAAMVSNIAALIIDKHSLYEQLKKDYMDDAIVKNED